MCSQCLYSDLYIEFPRVNDEKPLNKILVAKALSQSLEVTLTFAIDRSYMKKKSVTRKRSMR